MSSPYPIVVLAEQDNGELKPATWEGLALAREIQSYLGGPLGVVVLGDPVKETGVRLAEQSGEEVLAIQTPGLSGYHPEVYLQALVGAFARRPPAFAVIPHTSRYWDLAPRLALRLKLACLTGITKIVPEENRLGFLKPLYGGKIIAQLEPATAGAVLTFEPGYFKWSGAAAVRPGSFELTTVSSLPASSEFLELIPARETGVDLRAADTIVAAGRGIGRSENLDLIRRLAEQFTPSAVAGSRPLCDLGWLKYSQQVGLTGTTVSPKLYLALGISGAYQHVAGMKDSGFIVSVNRDPRAAILNWSDLVIVEDLETFLPLLIETIQNLQKESVPEVSG